MTDDAKVDAQGTSEVAKDTDLSGLRADQQQEGPISEQDREAEEFARQFLTKVIRLRGVKIDRKGFLKSELHKHGIRPTTIKKAVRSTPVSAGISLALLDEIADEAIKFETEKSTALSFAAGLPGGFAMLGTVPADVTQFYIHAFRVMQKLAYLYGWQSFLDDMDDIDDKTLGLLAAFLGVMMGVSGAATSVTTFAAQVARPALQKKIAAQALTKTAWYQPMKQTLRLVGVQVTKQSFAKTVTKVVPVVGGVVSGSLTFVTLNGQSKRLKAHLRELPPPGIDAEVYLEMVHSLDEALSGRPTLRARAKDSAGSAIRDAKASTVAAFTSRDVDGDGIPDAAPAVEAMRKAALSTTDALKETGGKLVQRLKRPEEAPIMESDTSSTGDATAEE